MPSQLLIIKLGGAILTDKGQYRTLRSTELIELTKALAVVHSEHAHMILVHGAGSFGHFEARDFKLNSLHDVDSSQQTAQGISKCRASLALLHAAVLDALVGEGMPAISVPVFPLGALHRKECVEPTVGYASIARALLQRGFVPVIHGDPVIVDRAFLSDIVGIPEVYHGDIEGAGMRASIVGGDEIASVLASKFGGRGSEYDAVHVIFVTGAPGIFTAPPPEWMLAGYTRVDAERGVVDVKPCDSRRIERISVACCSDGVDDYQVEGVVDSQTGDPGVESVESSPAQPTTGVADVTGGISAKLSTSIDIVRRACRLKDVSDLAVGNLNPEARASRTTVSVVGGCRAADDLRATVAILLAAEGPGHWHARRWQQPTGIPGTAITCKCS